MGLRKLTGQKTYWHLLQAQRRPSTYEIASSRLHYYPALGFGARTPAQAWYERYQTGSAFGGLDLEAFADPRKTTYASYTRLQREREAYLGGVLAAARDADDAAFAPDWLRLLARVFAPLRYPCHALMMGASYLATMAPESRVTIAAALQAADEIRRVNALARRLYQLRGSHAQLGDDARALWQEDPAWQGLRREIERMLVVYDWSECFVVLNLALKPAFDYLFDYALTNTARKYDDTVTAQLLASLAQDSLWHRAWSAALLRVLLAQSPPLRTTVAEWLRKRVPAIDDALAPLACVVLETGADARARAAALDDVARARGDYLAECGLAQATP